MNAHPHWKPITHAEYADAIFQAGVADRKQSATHRDVTAKGSYIRDCVLAGIMTCDPSHRATNIPVGNPVCGLFLGKIGPKPTKIVDAAMKVHSATLTGQIAIVFVGESHENPKDKDRAQGVLNGIGTAGAYDDIVIVLERKFTEKYHVKHGFELILESEIGKSHLYHGETARDFGLDKLEPDNRTIVLAGFLFAYCACGDQSRNVVFVVVCGDRHADFAKQFEYLVTAGGRFGMGWVERRPRSYLHAPAL